MSKQTTVGQETGIKKGFVLVFGLGFLCLLVFIFGQYSPYSKIYPGTGNEVEVVGGWWRNANLGFWSKPFP